MRSHSSPTLASFPFSRVRVACALCGRHGQHSKETLVHEYGADVLLADLLGKIAMCPLRERLGDTCGATYANLRSDIAQTKQPGSLDGQFGIPPTL
jgi:hypothetical protein